MTLTVPDELAEKIDRWRHRLELSKEFRTAIAKRIDRLEREDSEMEDGMNGSIERLRRERAESTDRAAKEGSAKGVAWAKSAPYDDLVYAAEDFDPSDPYGVVGIKPLVENEILGDYFFHELNRSPYKLREQIAARDGFLSGRELAWFQAWDEAVGAYWEKVRDAVENDERRDDHG
jgi:hypothetical protein